MQVYGAPSQRLSLAEQGQKRITWGKKHKNKTWYQVVTEDVGYLEWSLARYGALPPLHQEFVDYGRAQLQADAAQAVSGRRSA